MSLSAAKKVVGKPLTFAYKHTVAPMVLGSDLAFRMLVRRYGADLVYTAMFDSKRFVEDTSYREKMFRTCPEDRPLVVQFAANDSKYLYQAAKLVEPYCDAVDINLGCPQRQAHEGNYGSALLEPAKHDLVMELVSTLTQSDLTIPVLCKIRLLPTLEKTIAFAQRLEASGCSLLAVHGRKTGSQKKRRKGLAKLDWIKAVKGALTIPVLSNGNITTFEDIEHNLQVTGCDGVMTAEGILYNPVLFTGQRVTEEPRYYWGSLSRHFKVNHRLLKASPQDMHFNPENAVEMTEAKQPLLDSLALVYEYLALAKQHQAPVDWVILHLKKCLRATLIKYQTFFDILNAQTLEDIEVNVGLAKMRRDSGTYVFNRPLSKLQKKQRRENTRKYTKLCNYLHTRKKIKLIKEQAALPEASEADKAMAAYVVANMT
jgi:tRNA-dihydrouridine synthase